ncbi:LOW QUALITY PROTEIN: matrix metallopeptidase 30 [Lycodopsis pacificus]
MRYPELFLLLFSALAVKTVMIVVIVALCGAVTTSPSHEELAKAQDYPSVGVSAPSSSLDSFQDTLKTLQEYFGREVSGQLDSDTLEVMSRPRCGYTDRYGHFEGPRWDKTVVTYRITDYTPDLSQSDVDATIAKVMKLYSDIIPLDFQHIHSGTADIMIMFKARDHGDFAPFDGEGGVLTQAFSPGQGNGGDTHFDEDESWTLTSAGSNLFLVPAHEFGHALGLAHSQVQTALMYQYGKWDGISTHIQSVWPGISRVYEYKKGNTVIFFEGDDYWRIRGNAVLPGYPKPLSDFGLPPSVTKVDAAVYVSVTGRTLLFVQSRYWSYNERTGRMDGVPSIRRELPGIGSRVDAAFENSGRLPVLFIWTKSDKVRLPTKKSYSLC